MIRKWLMYFEFPIIIIVQTERVRVPGTLPNIHSEQPFSVEQLATTSVRGRKSFDTKHSQAPALTPTVDTQPVSVSFATLTVSRCSLCLQYSICNLFENTYMLVLRLLSVQHISTRHS